MENFDKSQSVQCVEDVVFLTKYYASLSQINCKRLAGTTIIHFDRFRHVTDLIKLLFNSAVRFTGLWHSRKLYDRGA